MRIGIDLQVLRQPRTGIGNYAFNLARTLLEIDKQNEYVLFVPSVILSQQTKNLMRSFGIPQDDKRIKVVRLPEKMIPIYDAHVRYARIFEKKKLDVLHGPANILPLLYRGKSVITLHDLAIYKHPEWFPGNQWLATKIVVPQSIKKADMIIVPSEATKRDLMELFRVPDEKIAVIPHGVEERFFVNPNVKAQMPNQIQSSNAKGYILSVGTIEPRKNHVRVLEAYSQLPKGIRDQYGLIIAGAKGWGFKDFDLKFESLDFDIRNGVKLLDHVPYEQLPGLYQHAAVFVYPSLYEGFGLPVLEAMASGVPVLTSRQVAQNIEYGISNIDQHSTFNILHSVSPYSVSEISHGIGKILSDQKLRGEMGRRGVERAKHFTWGETAAKTMEVYQSLI